MGYTSAQGNTAYVSDAMPAASLNLYTSNDFDFDPACFTELNMLNLELARRDLDAARERVAAMGCADAPAGKVALATVLLGAGQPNGRGAPWRKPPRRHGSNASARWTIRRWPTATCCTSCWACPTPPWQTPWNCSAARLASPVDRIRTTPTASPLPGGLPGLPAAGRGPGAALDPRGRPAAPTRPRWAGYAFCAATPPAGWIC